uniref:HECT-type E3 ubiquitin transferase n=1 Tax=Panagrellus redivivus TaxID=6233 RepID=A0A7E4UYV5_PANRE
MVTNGNAVFFIKVSEDVGTSAPATETQLGLGMSQLFYDSTKSVKLSWNFAQSSSTNLLDWIGMFEVDEHNPLQYIDYKSHGVCGSATGSVEWPIVADFLTASKMRTEVCFRYFDGLTGFLRASSPPLLVYSDAKLVVDAISVTNLKHGKHITYRAKVHMGESIEYKTVPTADGSWTDLNFAFQADRSREIQLVVKQKSWRHERILGEATIPIADLIYQRNQEFAFVLRPTNRRSSSHSASATSQFACQVYVNCHFIPENRQSIEETLEALHIPQSASTRMTPDDPTTTAMTMSALSESTSNSSVLSSSVTTSSSDQAYSSLSSGSLVLPPGWEARVDAKGRVIYLDHVNRTTTWKPPTVLEPESDDQSDLNSNARYPNARRTVSGKNNGGTTYTHPVTFLLRNNFVHLLHNNVEARQMYNDSIYLKHVLHKIRKEPSSFEKYAQNRELVDFLNSFADKTQPLPSGWQIARRPNADQRLFIDHQSRRITLIDPRLPNESKRRAHSAPPTRRNHDVNGNSMVSILQRTDEIARLVVERFPEMAPRVCQKLNAIKINGIEALLRYSNDVDLITAISVLDSAPTLPKTDFEEKVTYFYQALHRAGYGQGNGKIRFRLRRTNLLTDAFEKILSIDATQLKRFPMTVTFDEEDGLDYGGPSRELFFLLSRELFNPYYGLFECACNDNYTVQVSAMSKFVDNHLQWFELCGRILGLALIHRCMIDTFFTRAFYKMLQGLPYKLEDLQSMDLQYYNSLLWVRNNKITPDLELTFTTTEDIAGEVVERELLPGGKQILVTDTNKEEFITLMIRSRVERNAEAQNKALLRGVYSLVDREYLRVFDAKQLELVLSGTVEINIEDWRENTEYKNGFFEDHVVVRWFWDTVYSFSNAERLKLLQFVTGTSSIPFEGFKALRGSNGPKKFTIEKYGTENSLPRAHTCFNRLDLPAYPTKQVLLAKLQIAINESSSYAME